MQHSKEGLSGYSKEPRENKSERQPVEAQLQQPELAMEANDMIESIMISAKQNPRFQAGLAENYFMGGQYYVSYPDKDGNAMNAIHFERKFHDFYPDELHKNLAYQKAVKQPDGSFELTTSINLSSIYVGDKPSGGSVWSVNSPDKMNKRSVVREVRQIVAENFGNPVLKRTSDSLRKSGPSVGLGRERLKATCL